MELRKKSQICLGIVMGLILGGSSIYFANLYNNPFMFYFFPVTGGAYVMRQLWRARELLSFEKKYLFISVFPLLDIISTISFVNIYGIEIEGNFFLRYLYENLGFLAFPIGFVFSSIVLIFLMIYMRAYAGKESLRLFVYFLLIFYTFILVNNFGIL